MRTDMYVSVLADVFPPPSNTERAWMHKHVYSLYVSFLTEASAASKRKNSLGDTPRDYTSSGNTPRKGDAEKLRVSPFPFTTFAAPTIAHYVRAHRNIGPHLSNDDVFEPVLIIVVLLQLLAPTVRVLPTAEREVGIGCLIRVLLPPRIYGPLDHPGTLLNVGVIVGDKPASPL